MLKKVLEFLKWSSSSTGETPGKSTTLQCKESSTDSVLKIKELFDNTVRSGGGSEVALSPCSTTLATFSFIVGDESLEPIDAADFLPDPISCDLEGDFCSSIFSSYSHFQSHLTRIHSLVPIHSSYLTSVVIIYAGDLKTVPLIHPDLLLTYSWNPKWIRAFSNDFIFMITRMSPPGIWSFWLWILGSTLDAQRFTVRIRLVKDSDVLDPKDKFPVLPIGFPRSLIEESGNCWQIPDEDMRTFSKIGRSLITHIGVQVEIEVVDPPTWESSDLGLKMPSLASSSQNLCHGDKRRGMANEGIWSIPPEIEADLEECD